MCIYMYVVIRSSSPETKMFSRFRRLRAFCRVLHHFHSGNSYLRLRHGTYFPASHSVPLGHKWIYIDAIPADRGFHSRRFSKVAETSQESIMEDDFLSFIKSSFDNVEGPNNCWLNKPEAKQNYTGNNDVFLVLAGAFPVDSGTPGGNAAILFEKVKLLQQRHSKLQVIGFQTGSSIFSEAIHMQIAQMAMEGYITFPILLSSKRFTEVTDGARFIVFKGCESPARCYEQDVDIGVIDRAVKELMQPSGSLEIPNIMKSAWVKPAEVIKEPLACSSLRNLLLYFPGCISVDESGNRLFLSDINHHRVIIFDGSGKILDCIGSSPGFEDGDFESAKLMRPAASFYNASEDFLYFVDSENHAVRRADLGRRVVETFYPPSSVNKTNNSLWHWIMDKLWMERHVNSHLENLDSKSFMFPWHLIESSDKEIFVINQSFETLWIMNLASGVIKETVEGLPKVLEICGQMILEKLSLLKQIPSYLLSKQVEINCSLDDFQYAGLVSSVATFQDHVFICDKVGQRVLKIDRKSGISSSVNFSNFGILGLPYWVASPLESVYAVGDALRRIHVDHIESFSLLPGKVDIQLNVDLPEDTELVEPLQEGCVWRQARGAAVELSGAESKEASSEKVGIAQQWYDEIDHLVSPQEVVELTTKEENLSEENVPEGGICIDCTVHASPGTGEVIISAALYLRLKRNSNSGEDRKEKLAAKIADILNPDRIENIEKDPCFHLLVNSKSNLQDLIFLKPLNVRVKLDCLNHPKADNSRDIILTDSSVEVIVSL